MRFKSMAAIVALVFSCSAHAGQYGDELAKCLVQSTSKEDRAMLVRWMFAAVAANPAVAPIANVSPDVMDKANASAGALITRLLTDSCKDKAKQAFANEGGAAVQVSFQALGRVAATDMFSSPEVKKAISGLESNIDKKKIEALRNP